MNFRPVQRPVRRQVFVERHPRGEEVGTDGKAARTAAGFASPFAEDVLVPAVPAFGSKGLAGHRDASVGKTRGPATVVGFDDRDAPALLDALPGLPGGRDGGRPVTLDLDGAAAVQPLVPRRRLAHSDWSATRSASARYNPWCRDGGWHAVAAALRDDDTDRTRGGSAVQ